jgi:hypothetical protein
VPVGAYPTAIQSWAARSYGIDDPGSPIGSKPSDLDLGDSGPDRP